MNVRASVMRRAICRAEGMSPTRRHTQRYHRQARPRLRRILFSRVHPALRCFFFARCSTVKIGVCSPNRGAQGWRRRNIPSSRRMPPDVGRPVASLSPAVHQDTKGHADTSCRFKVTLRWHVDPWSASAAARPSFPLSLQCAAQ